MVIGALALISAVLPAYAQMQHGGEASEAAPYGTPVADQHVWSHVLLDRLEYRAGNDGGLNWDSQAWMGTDSNRLWLKSEATWKDGGGLEDGKHEILYDRPISTFFDLQAGVRVDADSRAGRDWGALGIQGLAPNFFEVSATLYASDAGNFAANATGSFDLLLTQRLILQPQIELNLYSKSEPDRGIGSGLSDLEVGLRLRYEIIRKFAPYVGVSYGSTFGQTRRLARAGGEDGENFHFVFGVRAWL